MNPTFLRHALPYTLVATIIILSPMGCIQSESETCKSGRVCPAGTRCSARGSECITGTCGDGIVQTNEECDDGDIVADSFCASDCRLTVRCGNEEVEKEADEQCDDGNREGGDGCSADCKSSEKCGNNILDPWEKCDDGNESSGDGCSANCLSNEECGNGARDSLSEQCDDGNRENGDGCSADCQSTERCGNGITDSAAGEVCDDGNIISGDGCSSNCRSNEKCGNGIVDPPEECDEGLDSKETICLRTCKLTRCGDGYTNRDILEACDDGNTSTCGTCSADCLSAQPPRPAEGRIQVHGPVQDGELLIVSNNRDSLFFEFDNDDDTPSAHIRVSFTAGGNLLDNAKSLYEAMADGGPDQPDAASTPPLSRLRFTVTRPDENGGTTLELTAMDPGRAGNQDIIESVESVDFKVKHIGGGAGFDCPVGTGCTSDDDCGPFDGGMGCVVPPDAGPTGACGPKQPDSN